MKVGDLVKPKHKYSNNEEYIGIVLKIEEEFYKRNSGRWEIPIDRLTVYWAHGETTTEPDNYVEKLAESERDKK